MKAVVTGATGFLGKRLTERLLEENHEVVALGRNLCIGEELNQRGASFISCDLTDGPALIEAVKEADVVFHCGALSAPWGKYEDFFNTNVIGTRKVIEACQMNNVKRLVHVSSPSIYFNSNSALNVKEDAALPSRFASVYSETKYLAELEIEKAHKEGLSTVVLRPRALFGPGDTSIIPRLIEINKKMGVPFINKGSALVDVTYIDNVVDALLLAADLTKPLSGKKYNITNHEVLKYAVLIELLFDALKMPYKAIVMPYSVMRIITFLMHCVSTYVTHKEPKLTSYTLGLITHSQTLCNEAAINELGYTPKISIKEGLRIYARSLNHD